MTIFITILVFKYGICVYEDIIAQGTKGYNKIKGLIYTRHNFEFSISCTYIIQNTFIPSRIIKLIFRANIRVSCNQHAKCFEPNLWEHIRDGTWQGSAMNRPLVTGAEKFF